MESEDTAISNLTSVVTSALEARGVLGKIRAELRASVFSAIHEQQQQQGVRPGTDPAVLKMFHQEGAGRVAAQVCAAPVLILCRAAAASTAAASRRSGRRASTLVCTSPAHARTPADLST